MQRCGFLLIIVFLPCFAAGSIDLALAADQPTAKEKIINILHRLQFCTSEAKAQADLVPSEGREFFLRALEATSQRRYNDSLALLDDLLKMNQKCTLGYLWKGYCYNSLYKKAAALQEFHKGLQIAPNEARLYDGLGSLMYREGQLDQALKYCQKALSLDPKDTCARMNIASIQKKRTQFDGAMEQLEAARSICPEDEWIQIAMGNLLLEKAKSMSLESTIRNSLKDDAGTGESDPRRWRADVMKQAMRRYPAQNADLMNQATRHYDEAIRLAPQQLAPYLAKGSYLEKMGKYTEAMEQYRMALNVDKNSAEPNIYIGNLLVTQKRTDEALKYFDEAIKTDSASADGHACKAACYAAMDKSDEANAEYRKAISIEPTNPSYMHALALYMRKKGRLKEAVELNREVLRMAPNNFGYHMELARCYREIGNEKAAQ